MRISQKEKTQLGYEPNYSPKTPSRSSDIDFSDVFGGPPRRASLQEMQNRNYNDDTWRGDGDGKDETVPGRSSWSVNASEKPVFGSEVSNRRRYPSRDFFDDIFRADQSQSSSPRMSARDPISSAPGSRILSPVRPLPPGAIPLGSPAQFSLPARLASSHSSSNISRLSSQGVNHDAYQGGDALSPYRRSPLSHKTSLNGEELRKDVNLDGIQAPSGGNQFHFSIHKWASKGMPLVMSLGKRNSLRSKIKLERALSLNGNVEDESDTLVGEIQPAAVNTDDVLSFKVHVVSAAKETKDSDQVVDKSVTDVPKLSPINKVEDGNSPAEESEVPALFKNSVSKDVSKPDIDTNKSDPKQRSKSNKLHGVEEASGNESAVPQTRVNKKVVENKSPASSEVDKKEYGEEKSKMKGKSSLKEDNKRNNINFQKNLGNDTARENVKESTGNDRVGENLKVDKRKGGTRGKVKEFVKIFNQEPSIKTAADIDGRWRNTDSLREHSKSTLSSSKTQGFDMNIRLDSSPKVDENHKVSSGKQIKGNNVPEPCQSSSIESENMGSTIDSASDGFKSSSANIDVAFDSILIEELPEIQDKTSENVETDEDVRAYESKVLKWSKGKEGNIRALLSTLQYVLWPNCGWKPVPLVDIIEASAVKRSYQRALLYVHPDKLQQKGAASHHKYIADKVFDTLQEAWDNFNNLGSL